MAGAGTYNLEICQGASFRRDLSITFGGGAMDLRNVTIRSAFRNAVKDQTPTFTLAFSASIIAPAQTSGIVRIELTKAQTCALDTASLQNLVWDLFADDDGTGTSIHFYPGQSRKLATGTVTLDPAVTDC